MAEEITGPQAGRRLAAMRKRYTKVCPVCGQAFEGMAKRIYDRPACQTKAYRLRRQDRPPK